MQATHSGNQVYLGHAYDAFRDGADQPEPVIYRGQESGRQVIEASDQTHYYASFQEGESTVFTFNTEDKVK